MASNKVVSSTAAKPKSIANLVVKVGAGFIPARGSRCTDSRAGINPALTNNRCRLSLKLAGSVLAISFGIQDYTLILQLIVGKGFVTFKRCTGPGGFNGLDVKYVQQHHIQATARKHG